MMRSNFPRVVLLAVMALALLAVLGAKPAFSDSAAFNTLLGSWGGTGEYSLADGTRARIKCNAYYTGGGSQLGMAIRCSSDNNKIEIRSKLNNSGGRITGHWEERTYNAEGDAIGVLAARPVFEYLGASHKLALDLYLGGGGHSLKLPQQHNFVRFLDYMLYGVALPNTVPPGDATNTPTDVQLRRDPYLTGAEGGLSVYDVYYGGLRTMMPWLGHGPRP